MNNESQTFPLARLMALDLKLDTAIVRLCSQQFNTMSDHERFCNMLFFELNDDNHDQVIGNDNIKLIDELLANAVRTYPNLYDHEDKNFRDVLMKESTWEEIASSINMSVSDCRNRWTRLRERFVREKRRREREVNKDVDGAYSQRTIFSLYDNMLFLDKHIKRRSSTGESSRSKRPKDAQPVNNQVCLPPGENSALSRSVSLSGTTDAAESNNSTTVSSTISSQLTSPPSNNPIEKSQTNPTVNFLKSFGKQYIQSTSTAPSSMTIEHIPLYTIVPDSTARLPSSTFEESNASTNCSASIPSAEESSSSDIAESCLLSIAPTIEPRLPNQSNIVVASNSEIPFGMLVAAELERLPESERIKQKRAIWNVLYYHTVP